MMMIMYLMITMMIIIFIMSMIIPMINKHVSKDRETLSPFECGFDPFSKSRIPFSIHFLSISLMFLIFDIEITLILPIPIILNYLNIYSWSKILSSLLMILIWGLILEWKEGSMNWK